MSGTARQIIYKLSNSYASLESNFKRTFGKNDLADISAATGV